MPFFGAVGPFARDFRIFGNENLDSKGPEPQALVTIVRFQEYGALRLAWRLHPIGHLLTHFCIGRTDADRQ